MRVSRVSILGPGQLRQICRHAKMKRKELEDLIDKVGKLLADLQVDIVIIPSEGVPYHVAKAYRKCGGRRVWGIVPPSDDKFGISHIKPYLHVVDKKIEAPSWYHADGEIAAASNVALVIGLSAGTLRDISVLHYHHVFFQNKTHVVVFSNTISAPLPLELEEDLYSLIYIKKVEELKRLLSTKFKGLRSGVVRL